MEWITKALAWWNGKKTIIGSICLWVGTILLPFVISNFGLEFAWLNQLISILVWVGGILTPVGFGHKGAKAISKK